MAWLSVSGERTSDTQLLGLDLHDNLMPKELEWFEAQTPQSGGKTHHQLQDVMDHFKGF